ncbi:DUF3224 domain-containing protein [Amycolatopsis taiwanensis]|uniref:DUF3224 domain-containing protein n=1 Tax=Amycolatopsis taiwanensis TaxID=342230 RepID=A0A9W6QYY9_9PSEU|nr:DUF3224 domain-containing protein [Amycolatopsis taiwanensis]GLY65431.1 hypothetical protein Atai01_20500 [Amycolatopsis taiwanensis]
MTENQRPRHQQSSGESKVVVTGFDRFVISEPDDSGVTLVSDVLRERFTGSLVGEGTADHVRVLYPDGRHTFTGVERITGALDGRTGSFVLTAQGYSVDGMVHGRWEVVPQSATGELAGLRGHGVFTADTRLAADADIHANATDCFTYWYE